MIDPRAPDYENTPVSLRRPRFGYAPADAAASPVVSIVTPYYNTGAVFHETARSILGQSLQQWEWIIVNDASTDREALAVLAEYRGRDPRIRVIDHEVNRGLSGARNTGFRAARTEFVFQIDSDDLMEPTAIEKMLWFLHAHPEVAFVNAWSVAFGGQRYLWPRGFEEGDRFLSQNVATSHALIRRSAFLAAGGYDETIRGGMEDWDFWLRCANQGLWGATIPEYLEWYRRRPDHGDRWENWSEEGVRRFVEYLRGRYPRVYQQGIPKVHLHTASSPGSVRIAAPFANRLRRDRPRLLLIVPWMVMGGADKFNLDLLEQLTRRGWEVTVAATLPSDHPWMPEFARYTPDIFALANFLPVCEHPAFLRYLIESRQPDVVLISNSEFGYRVLPFLRTSCPGPAWVDFCHMEEEGWKEGGYPRYANANQDFLDLNLVTSEHLKDWMVARGGDPQQIEVVYINVDPDHWAPQPAVRERVRGELGIRPDEPVLLFVGRLCAQKQPRVLAGTLRELRQRGCAFQALIVGDGPDRAWLAEFLKLHGLESHVRLLGALGPQQVREMYWASDVLFLPSAHEGIALAIYEAMAAGLPIVGADVGGQREVATPECAILLPRSDEVTEIQQYANELEVLLRDPARRAAMGRAGRVRIEKHFTLDAMGQRMLALFAAAQQRGKTHPKPAIPLRLAGEIAVQAVEAVRLEQGWSWWEQQCRGWEHAAEQSKRTMAELEGAKAWLEQQRSAWEQRARQAESRITALESAVADPERAKTWLEEQRSNWEQTARASEQTIRELRAWTAELEKAKVWLSEQVEQHQAALRTQRAQLDTLRRRVERCRRRWAYRVLARLGLMERLDGD
jgi:glycosyltransferase involved in cell wall biosynthesis